MFSSPKFGDGVLPYSTGFGAAMVEIDEEPIAEASGDTRYAYFSCNADGTLVSYGEECTDDGCTPGNCGIGEVNVTSPACYIAGGYVHYATCASDGSTVTVRIDAPRLSLARG